MRSQLLREKSLALCFTIGVSLNLWHETGMLTREIAIYNELSKYFKNIYFFTYGMGDLKYKSYLSDNITIVPKKYIKNDLLYSFLLPLIHRKMLKEVDLLKTNQMPGSWSAVLAKLMYRKKLVVRTGYMWSIHLDKENIAGWQRMLSKNVEKLAYKRADSAITSSQTNFDYVERNYHPRDHVLVPNYVETDVFKPLNMAKEKGSLCFVGRLTGQKNLFDLFEALSGLSYTIDLIGSGEDEEKLKESAREHKIDASFLGNVPNHDLPEILNKHEVFILPSLYEGMPKTLLEAMSCGLAVIGTNIDGTREVIKHGENGILCESDPK
jgi:glycosyltransferase involved in cell wall biosynthesis